MRKALVTLALLAGSVPLWAHKGVRHGEGAEEHPHVQVLELGTEQQFRVTLAYLPDRPLAGQRVQFLFRFEEVLAFDDPLLGNRAPLVPRKLVARFETEDSAEKQTVELAETHEPGVFQFQHIFTRGLTHTLLMDFEGSGGAGAVIAVPVPVRPAPTNWTLLLLQGAVLVAGIGGAVHLFRGSAGPRRQFSSGLVGAATFALCIFLSLIWPSHVPAVNGILEPEAVAVADAPATPVTDVGYPLALPDWVPTDVFVGTVVYPPDRIAQIRSPFPGTIIYNRQTPEIGDRVRDGQVLAIIENQFNMHDYVHLFPQRWELAKEVMTLEDSYVQAEADFGRVTQLLELGTIAQREYDRAEFAYRQAVSALQKAQERLDLHDAQIKKSALKATEIRSPISGLLTRATYTSGQMIYEGDSLFEVIDLSEVWLQASIRSQDLQRVREQHEVRLAPQGRLERSYRARLLTIRPAVEPESKTIQVVYSVRNRDLWLKQGMLVDVFLGQETKGEKAP